MTVRCGLVVRIGRSHRLGPGSIPGTGTFFFVLPSLFSFLLIYFAFLQKNHYFFLIIFPEKSTNCQTRDVARRSCLLIGCVSYTQIRREREKQNSFTKLATYRT